MSNQIELSVNFKDGSFSLRADKHEANDLIPKIESLLAKFWKGVSEESEKKPPLGLDQTAPAPADQISLSQKKEENSRKRGDGKNRRQNWQPVELGLDAAGLAALREDFLKKKPFGQNAEVAVLAVKLKDLLGRDSFGGDEIATALKLVGAKIPGNLLAVFRNMKVDRIADCNDNKLVCSLYTDDYITHRLKTKVEKAA